MLEAQYTEKINLSFYEYYFLLLKMKLLLKFCNNFKIIKLFNKQAIIFPRFIYAWNWQSVTAYTEVS